MATVEDAIFSRLSGYAGLTALVSTRIYPVIQPQDGALPSVTYQLVAGRQESAMGSDATIKHRLYQFNAWATTYDSAVAIIDQVEAALRRFRGTVATIEILDVFLRGEQQLFEEDLRVHHHTRDLEIHHRVAA